MVENKVVMKLQETLTNLETANPVLLDGQEVIVTGISLCITPPRKRGNGSLQFSALPFIDLLKIETDSNYDLTQSFLGINGTEVEITNTSTTNDLIIANGGEAFELKLGATGKYRRIDGVWTTTGATGSGGATADGVLGEDVNEGDVLYFANDGLLYIASNTEEAKAFVAGVSLKAALTGAKVTVQKSGELELFSGLTTGTNYYLGAAGNLVALASLAVNNKVVYIGKAVSATAIDVNIQPPKDNIYKSCTLGETIAAPTAFYFGSDGKAYACDNRELLKSIVAGFIILGGNVDDEVLYATIQTVSGFTGLVAGTSYYLGNSGQPITKGSILDGEQIVFLGTAISTTELDLNIQPPQPANLYVDAPLGTKVTNAISGNSWLLSHGFAQVAYDNGISKSVYSACWDAIQHMYNAAHVAVGDPDLEALDNGLFYPTPPPDSYGRVGIPDISIDGTSLSLPSGFRNGTLFIVKSGTSQAVGTELYIRRIDATTVSYHSSEDGAINNTGAITVTGTGVLTQEGIRLEDAGQRITGEVTNIVTKQGDSDGVGVFDTTEIFVGVASSGTTRSYTDVAFDSSTSPDSKQNSNEFRGKTHIEFDYYKIEAVTPSGETVSAQRYDTGWVANSDWTQQILSVTHSLNADISSLYIDFYISSDGTDDNSFKAIPASNENASSFVGYGLHQVDKNNILITTAAEGIRTVSKDALNLLIDTESYYYKVVVIKPNLVATVSDVPDVVEITDAVDVIKTLPNPAEMAGERIYRRKGSGTGKFTLNCPSGVFLDFGDALLSSVDLEGNGTLIVTPSGSNLLVKEFRDSGSNSNGEWEKLADGTLKCSHEDSTVIVTSTASGNVYFGATVLTYPKEFIEVPVITPAIKKVNSLVWGVARGDSTTTTTECGLYVIGSGAAASGRGGYTATGRWRA